MNQWQGGSSSDKSNRAVAVAIKKATKMRLRHKNQPNTKSADRLTESLQNLANILTETGRHEEASQAIQEAEQIQLLDAAKWAQDLMAKASALFDQGAYDEALFEVEESEILLRALSKQVPTNVPFVASLAWSLNLKGILCSNLNLREKALTATEESVRLRKHLHNTQPEVFAPDLANSLNNLGNRLNELGRRDEATLVSNEAVVLYRKLYKTDPEEYLSYLTSSLANLSARFSVQGLDEDAFRAIHEAVGTFIDYQKDQPNGLSAKFLPSLALCLDAQANVLSALLLYERALNAIKEAKRLYIMLFEDQPGLFIQHLARCLSNMGAILRNLGKPEEALRASQASANLYRRSNPEKPEVFIADLVGTLINQGCVFTELGRREEAQAVRHEAGVLMVGQDGMNPRNWCQRLSAIAPKLTSAHSLRQIHLVALSRIADLRRVPYFDSLAGPSLIGLQALLVADLWKKLAAAGRDDPELMDDTLPVLLSALQSPDLMRWLAANQNTTPEGRALTQAQSEFLQANEEHAQLIVRLRGDRDGNRLSGGGMRQAPAARQVSATEGELSAADQRSRSARAALHRAEEQLAKADPAFRSAYEVPSSAELHAMLARLQQASTAQHESATDTAALMCFLELPAHADQASRLVGVLLSSESTHARQIEFPGLKELAQKFEHYRPLGQRSSHTLRQLSDSTSQPSPSHSEHSEKSPIQDFELLLGEIEQLWWAPLAKALGEELPGLKVLHLCSHGIAHQLPFSQVSHLSLSGNVQLFQWPGLPYLRLAYDHGYTDTAAEVQTAPALWQVAHDCAWHHEVPLPMVAVEAYLLRKMIDSDTHGTQSVESPAQIHSNAHALVVCSHGSEAQGVNSAVQLRGGNLTTGEVMRRKLGPRMALIPACYAADTADDHAHNALGVAAGFLLSGSRVVVGSIKAVPDTLMPWFSTLLTWYVVHEKLALHTAAVRARQDFGAGQFPDEYVCWIKENLPQALACLHPQGEESRHWAGRVPKDSLMVTASNWPWRAMDKDALIARRPVDLQAMHAAAQQVAANAFVPLGPQTRHQMREMAAFLIVFGMG